MDRETRDKKWRLRKEQKANGKIKKENEKIKKENDKLDKWQMKIDKQKAKIKQQRIKRFYRLAKVPKNATIEVINSKILQYLQKPKASLFDEVIFTEEQENDVNFMLGVVDALYKKHYDEGFKKGEKDLEENALWETISNLVLSSNDIILGNSEFLKKFIKKYNNINIIKLLSFYYHGDKFKNILINIPEENICSQAKIFGSDMLYYLPKDLPQFVKAVASGVECDGFKSVELLDISQVVENIELIINAYHKDGLGCLANYLLNTLNPNRNTVYMCHGEPHDKIAYDEEYAEVQQTLLNDWEIQTIFAKGKKLRNGKSDDNDKYLN